MDAPRVLDFDYSLAHCKIRACLFLHFQESELTVDGIFTYKSCFNLIILDDYVGNKAMGKTGM